MPWAQLDKTYRDGNNVGVRHGQPSLRGGGRYLHCIDLDIRDPKFIDVAKAKLGELFPGVMFNFFPTVSRVRAAHRGITISLPRGPTVR